MTSKLISAATCAALALVLTTATTPAKAAGESLKPPSQYWSFSGPFGRYDQAQLRRGFQVFREVCASCHGLKYIAFRNLGEPGGLEFTEDEVKAIAAEYTVQDGPNADGEMFERPAKPADRWPPPFENDVVGALANNGVAPPDASLLAKARAAERGFPSFVIDMFTTHQEAGVDYIYALLTGYEDEPPEGVEIADGLSYNPYFLGGNAIAMVPPLFDEAVEYEDGTAPTIDNYARDVAAFMMWAAEPKLEQRKFIGVWAFLYLAILGALLYLIKKKIWRRVGH